MTPGSVVVKFTLETDKMTLIIVGIRAEGVSRKLQSKVCIQLSTTCNQVLYFTPTFSQFFSNNLVFYNLFHSILRSLINTCNHNK